MTTETHPNAKQPDAPQTETERIRELLSWLDPLCRNPDFQKFLEHLRRGVDGLDAVIFSTNTPADQREIAVHKRELLKANAEWPEKQRAACIEHLRSADRPAPPPRSF